MAVRQNIVVLTGAGISKESGIPTFRDNNGMWKKYDAKKLASVMGFEEDPQAVLDFYNARRKNLLEVQPNHAHKMLAELEKQHNVTIISDEIHCEMVMPGVTYTPFASISQEAGSRCITCGSPSKSFNIAGLQAAFIVSNNAENKARINRAINVNEVCDINPFGLEAFMAAYNHGESWIMQFNDYIAANFQLMRDMIEKELPSFHFTPIEGTYLAWVNIAQTGMTSTQVTKKILDDGKVLVNDGAIYGKAGEGFIRINLATRRAVVEEAAHRIIDAMK